MERLLDFSKPLDIPLLEQVVVTLNTSPDKNLRTRANEVLTAFKNNEDSWRTAGEVLTHSKDFMARFFALGVLEDAVKFRWKALPNAQREGIRNFVVKQLIDMTSVDGYTRDPNQRTFVNKLNIVLVQILKQEWPHNWPNFIPEIIASSKENEVLCENNMNVLRLLSEETFDYSKEEMVSEKVKLLKGHFNDEFRQIFELCILVLNQSSRPSLIRVTLKTLLRFLSWIPLGYIFETPLINQLLTKFLPVQQFRNAALECLTEIALLEVSYDAVFQNMHANVLGVFQHQLPLETDIAEAYAHANDYECNLIRGLALFLTTFYSKHLSLVENPENQAALTCGMKYLVNISMVDDTEIFKICIEFWNKFAKGLYDNELLAPVVNSSMMHDIQHNLTRANGISFGGDKSQSSPLRKTLYAEVLSRVRHVMVLCMAKPEEVLVVEGDDGTIVRETTKDTDAIALYKTMRDTLVYLTHLDSEDSENIMLAKLAQQCETDKNYFTWNDINKLCWAIGSISGSMQESDEKRFLVAVIKDLLSLCECKTARDDKAVVASNIMYVVGQYPRFLKAHWKFLKTVVIKLFDFMHELHEGVQDMACDTFLKIAHKCKSQFVILHQTEQTPFINYMLSEFDVIVAKLQPHQRHVVYEAVGYMIKMENDERVRNALLEKLMSPTSSRWKELMTLGAQNPEALKKPESIQSIADILRVNVSVCTALGYHFRPHLMQFYLDMLHVYKFCSTCINEEALSQGAVAIQFTNMKAMKAVKVQCLRLIEVFVSKAEVSSDISNNFFPPICEPIWVDYQQILPLTRNHEVLGLATAIIEKVKHEAVTAVKGEMVAQILQPLFGPTLDMITKNFTDFPEHRLNFYRLLKGLNMYCFEKLFAVPEDMQKNLVNSIIWAFKHTERGVAETGLEILDRLLRNVEGAPDSFSQNFYQAYYMPFLDDVLYVLTDRLHKNSFSMQATILKQLFGVVCFGRVKVPLGDRTPENAQMPNATFLQHHVNNLIGGSFPNIGKAKLEKFVVRLFEPMREAEFEVHIRDFLITIREFSGEDDDQLFLQEKEEQARLQRQQQLRQRAAVPGMLTQAEEAEMAEL